MTMKSVNLLPALREVPTAPSRRRMSFREIITGLVNTDRAFYGAEMASAASFGLWAIFPGINVDDNLRETMTQAHEMAFGNYDGTLTEHWQEIADRGSESMTGFISNLTGKMAEINFKESLEGSGFTNVTIAPDPTQPVWDISAISPEGQDVLFQVKTGLADRAGEVEQLMEDNPDVFYAVSTEIYDRITVSAPEMVNRIVAIGPNHELVNGTTDGLNVLSGNMGIDIPDRIVNILPYAAGIIAGARLIYSVLRTEREFKDADRTDINKIHVVRTLTLMSRMGISTVMAAVGGAGGGIAGTAIPGIGNLIGTIVGTVGGAGIGMYLNRHLQPRMLNLALNITRLERDDLFYFKNKKGIDQLGWTFRRTAASLPT